MDIIIAGIVGSFCAGMATAVGAIPVLFIRNLDKRWYAAMLGFAAGVMLAASFFSLLTPALERGTVTEVIVGFLLGVLFLELSDKYIPHEHFFKGAEGSRSRLRRISLFILAITIHNFPEGLSVGVGFGSGDFQKALALAVGIGIQNIPEGTAVALPLRGQGYSKGYSFWMAVATGLVEPLGGILGVLLVVAFSAILPGALAFAAGCMLYVISGEIIPESHSEGNGKLATVCLILGFVVMMCLDNVFG